MRAPGDIFEGTIEFDPGGDLQPLLKSAPPRWAVYLLADEHDRTCLLFVTGWSESTWENLPDEEADA